jgi:hypothetical protein
MRKRRIGTAKFFTLLLLLYHTSANVEGLKQLFANGITKFFTLLLLLYHTSAKSQGIKQLMAGGGVALIGMQLIPLLANLFN